jgi:hypothetical protein
MLHVKDLGPRKTIAVVPVGGGTIDSGRIFAPVVEAGVKHYIVDLEGEASTTQAAETSYCSCSNRHYRLYCSIVSSPGHFGTPPM